MNGLDVIQRLNRDAHRAGRGTAFGKGLGVGLKTPMIQLADVGGIVPQIVQREISGAGRAQIIGNAR